MATSVQSEGLTPAAMDLQPAFYPMTNASQVTSTDDTNNGHHDDNSSATAALIISTTALLGLLIAGSVYIVYKYKGRKAKHVGGYENIEKTDATNSNQQEPPADV